jgi:hypothetical protein
LTSASGKELDFLGDGNIVFKNILFTSMPLFRFALEKADQEESESEEEILEDKQGMY